MMSETIIYLYMVSLQDLSDRALDTRQSPHLQNTLLLWLCAQNFIKFVHPLYLLLPSKLTDTTLGDPLKEVKFIVLVAALSNSSWGPLHYKQSLYFEDQWFSSLLFKYSPSSFWIMPGQAGSSAVSPYMTHSLRCWYLRSWLRLGSELIHWCLLGDVRQTTLDSWSHGILCLNIFPIAQHRIFHQGYVWLKLAPGNFST